MLICVFLASGISCLAVTPPNTTIGAETPVMRCTVPIMEQIGRQLHAGRHLVKGTLRQVAPNWVLFDVCNDAGGDCRIILATPEETACEVHP